MFSDSDLPEITLAGVGANAMFGLPGVAGKSYDLPIELRRYLALFTYLSDKAAWEYNAARRSMLAFNKVRAERKDAMPSTTGISLNLDNCIVTLDRLVRVFSAFSKGENHFLMDRTEKTLIEGYLPRIKNFRNALQHTEEHLQSKNGVDPLIPDGTPVFPALRFGSGKIVCGAHELRSSDLRDMVQRLHQLALGLATAIKRFDNQVAKPITNIDVRNTKA